MSNNMGDIYVSANNIHIEDSYTINHRQFEPILSRLKDSYTTNVFKRSLWSLQCEWAAHNVLYKLHLFRSHTKDVDLNYPLKWWVETFYIIFGTLVYVFA